MLTFPEIVANALKELPAEKSSAGSERSVHERGRCERA